MAFELGRDPVGAMIVGLGDRFRASQDEPDHRERTCEMMPLLWSGRGVTAPLLAVMGDLGAQIVDVVGCVVAGLFVSASSIAGIAVDRIPALLWVQSSVDYSILRTLKEKWAYINIIPSQIVEVQG